MTIKGAQGPGRAGLLLTLGVLAWAGAAQAQSLDEIIEAAVAATGGRDAIAQIETVRHSGSFTMGTDFGPIEGSLEIVIIPNQKMYQALISDLFSQRSAWDGTAAWQSEAFTGTVELTGAAAANLRNQTALDGFQAYQNPVFPDAEYAKADDEQVDGRDHFVLEISASGIPYRYFIDKETHLVTLLTLEMDVPEVGGVIEVTVRPSEYERFEGVLMARRTQLSIPGIYDLDMRISETVINEPVDQAIFAKP